MPAFNSSSLRLYIFLSKKQTFKNDAAVSVNTNSVFSLLFFQRLRVRLASYRSLPAEQARFPSGPSCCKSCSKFVECSLTILNLVGTALWMFALLARDRKRSSVSIGSFVLSWDLPCSYAGDAWTTFLGLDPVKILKGCARGSVLAIEPWPLWFVCSIWVCPNWTSPLICGLRFVIYFPWTLRLL